MARVWWQASVGFDVHVSLGFRPSILHARIARLMPDAFAFAFGGCAIHGGHMHSTL